MTGPGLHTVRAILDRCPQKLYEGDGADAEIVPCGPIIARPKLREVSFSEFETIIVYDNPIGS
jgi:hypothetical protein